MTKKIKFLAMATIFLSSLTMFFVSCDKDDDPVADDTPTGEVIQVKQYEVVSLNFSQELAQQEYNASLGSYTTIVKKLNDTTLLMCIPQAIPDTYILTIDGLGTYKDWFKVSETVLTETPDNTVTRISSGISDYTATLPDSDGDKAKLQSYLNSFNEQFNSATETEKESVALFLKANKEVFDEILYNNYENEKNAKGCIFCVSSLTKFKISVLAMGAGVAVAWISPDPTTKLIGALLTVVGFKKAKYYGQDITFKRLNILGVSIAGIMGDKSTALKFSDGQEKELSMATQNRVIANSDRSSQTSDTPIFFTAFDAFNTSINTLNNVISFVNENLPLINMDLVPAFNLENLSNETYNLENDTYNNFTFSVTNSNVTLTKSFSAEGKILMTMEFVVGYNYTEPLAFKLKVTYTDGFNDIEKLFDVTLDKEKEAYSIEILSGNEQTGTIDEELSDSVKVLVKDADGNPFEGATVNFSVTEGSVSSVQATSGADGIPLLHGH